MGWWFGRNNNNEEVDSESTAASASPAPRIDYGQSDQGEGKPLYFGAQEWVNALCRRIDEKLEQPTNPDEPSLVVGLYGEWGSGKSTLLNAIYSNYDQRLEQGSPESIPTIPIQFNAWRYEREPHLIIPLLKTAEQKLRTLESKPELWNSIKTNAQLLTHSIVAIGAGISGKLSLPFFGEMSFDVGKMLDYERERWEEIKSSGQNNSYLSQMESIYFNLNRHLQGLTGRQEVKVDEIKTNKINLIFLVDDLDRCLPDKSVEVLEAIKLFLEVPGCAFVLAVDDQVVHRGIDYRYRHYHKNDNMGFEAIANSIDEGRYSVWKRNQSHLLHNHLITGNEYLEKIIHLPVQVPKPMAFECEQYIREKFSRLIEIEGQQVKTGDQETPDIVKLLAEIVPSVPRKLDRVSEMLLLQMDIALQRQWQDINIYFLARLVCLQIFAPELYRFGWRERGMFQRLWNWASAHPNWEATLEIVATSISKEREELSSGPDNERSRARLRTIEKLDLPLLNLLKESLVNRSGFDARLIVSLDFSPPSKIHRYYQLKDHGEASFQLDMDEDLIIEEVEQSEVIAGNVENRVDDQHIDDAVQQPEQEQRQEQEQKSKDTEIKPDTQGRSESLDRRKESTGAKGLGEESLKEESGIGGKSRKLESLSKKTQVRKAKGAKESKSSVEKKAVDKTQTKNIVDSSKFPYVEADLDDPDRFFDLIISTNEDDWSIAFEQEAEALTGRYLNDFIFSKILGVATSSTGFVTEKWLNLLCPYITPDQFLKLINSSDLVKQTVNNSGTSFSDKVISLIEIICKKMNPPWQSKPRLVDLEKFDIKGLTLRDNSLNDRYLRGLVLKEDYFNGLFTIKNSDLVHAIIEIDVDCYSCNLFGAKLSHNIPERNRNVWEPPFDRAYLLNPLDVNKNITLIDGDVNYGAACVAFSPSAFVFIEWVKDLTWARNASENLLDISGISEICVVGPRRAAVLGTDNRIQIVGNDEKYLLPQQRNFTSLTMSFEENHLLTVDTSGVLRIWDIEARKSIRTVRISGAVTSISKKSDLEIVINNGSELRVLHSGEDSLRDVKSSVLNSSNLSGAELVSLDQDTMALVQHNFLEIYDFKEDTLFRLDQATSTLMNKNIAGNACWLACLSVDEIGIWKWKERVKVFSYKRSSPKSVFFIDQDRVAILYFDGLLVIVDMENQKLSSAHIFTGNISFPLVSAIDNTVRYSKKAKTPLYVSKVEDKLLPNDPSLSDVVLFSQDDHKLYPFFFNDVEVEDNGRVSHAWPDSITDTDKELVFGQLILED